MARSKENVRENKAMQSILRGENPEKRIMVGYDTNKKPSGDQIDRLSDIMKEARMPWSFIQDNLFSFTLLSFHSSYLPSIRSLFSKST